VTGKSKIKLVISLCWYVSEGLTNLVRRFTGREAEGRLVVLYYHAVPSVTRARFARQMDVLRRRTTVVRAAHNDALAPGAPSVAITFDDALDSVAKNALPELIRRSLPSTVFVPVDFVGKSSGWNQERNGAGPETVMTADELRSLPGLVELGSHSRTHPHLTTIEEAQLREEIAGSRGALEGLVGAPVTLFAFPYGEHDGRVVELCREAGYERVFGIAPYRVDPLSTDFVRGRVPVEPTDTRLEFYLKMRGAYGWMPRASAVKGAFRRTRGGS
jgi:peptidoglycan/xylan/chitin deacetylase (PgdA/CDA1 family)